MPNYDYYCESCKEVREVFQRITEAPLRTCPACGQETFQRQIGGGNALFCFKGSGFYKTDYAKGKPTESATRVESSGCGCKGKHECA